jgi:hypothetical protein
MGFSIGFMSSLALGARVVLGGIEATLPTPDPLDDPPDGPAAQDSPWEDGVEPQSRDTARALFLEGNGYFERGQYPEALQRYRAAVESWDHPAVHFNITVCLINLDQPVLAHTHLERALRFGPEGLGPHFHAQAVTYEKLLLGRLARLEVVCPQPDAQVRLDGKLLLTCPGRQVEHLLPGEHLLVASKPGYTTLTQSLDLRAGEQASQTLELEPLGSSKRIERRWKPWVPWIPTATGAAAVLVGGGVRALAASNVAQFDREVERLCPQGCAEESLPESVRKVRSRAAVENVVSIALFTAGGAAVVTGAVLFVLNRRREVEVPPPQVGLGFDRNAASLVWSARF